MILGMFGEALGLTTCLIAKQKSLSLTLFQICIAVTYFFMISIDVNAKNEDSFSINSLVSGSHGHININQYVSVCVNMCLAKATFALLWMMTVEIFPKKYRYICICYSQRISNILSVSVFIFLIPLQYGTMYTIPE